MMNLLPSPENVRAAGAAIRDGKLVVMPTETVYGLAADGTNRRAVEAIFAAKGRPLDNPLILHIGEPEWMDELAVDIPDYARELAVEFWPGPLTLVLPKLPHILDEVTAGLDSVAIRMPAHEIALQIIREAGTPIAAPSANRFMGLSPTRAEHVDPEIAASAEMIIDGGNCAYGVESTVVDCTSFTPRILRPGGVSRAKLEALIGMPMDEGTQGARRSPGLYAKHYAPHAKVVLVNRLGQDDAGLTLEEPLNPNQLQLPNDPIEYAKGLYDALHTLDVRGLPEIRIQRPAEGPDWEAIWDRIRKAAG
jgi:L-threonylcarbamoyladenylate synthase